MAFISNTKIDEIYRYIHGLYTKPISYYHEGSSFLVSYYQNDR